MLDYPLLAALSAVVREGGFDRAATTLGITPSAVSQRVRLLEERLGAVLVVRGQPPRPTELGARLCAHAERVRLLEAELASELPPAADAPVLPIVPVAVNADSLAAWVLPATARFSEATGARLAFVLDDEEHTADRLRSGEVLAAVTTDPTPVHGCRVRALGALRYVACASPDFMRRWFDEGVSAAALARAPTLRFDRCDQLQARWAGETFGASVDTAPVTWLPSTQGFVDAARLGMGWAMHPLALTERLLAAGDLVELAPGRPLDVALYWQRQRIGGRLLDRLGEEILRAARESMVGRSPAAVNSN